MEKRKAIHFTTEISIFTALALVLDILCGFVGDLLWPEGGTVSIAIIPILLMGYKYGPKGGFLSAFLFGSIQLIWSGHIVNIWSIILDYVLAYGATGIASLYYKKVSYKTNSEYNTIRAIFISLGIFLASITRCALSTISGMVCYNIGFYESLIYNASYIGLSMVIVIPLTIILVRSLKRYLFAE